MKLFVESEQFRGLNCGFALDEGTVCFCHKLKAFFTLADQCYCWTNR